MKKFEPTDIGYDTLGIVNWSQPHKIGALNSQIIMLLSARGVQKK